MGCNIAFRKNALKSYRQRNSISLDAIAAMLGCSKATVSRIENGKQNISSELLLKICEVTNNQVTPNDLLLPAEAV